MSEFQRSKVRRDYLNADGATELRKRIEDFWVRKGRRPPEISLVLKVVNAKATVELKSNMVDGWPQ